MATLRNKKKLAASDKENCKEHPGSNVAQNSNVPRSQDEIEERVIKKFSQELSRAENRILGALARLDDFLMDPLIQGHSGTSPETSCNALITDQGTNEDESRSDPHPEAGIFHNQMTQKFGPEDGDNMLTGATEQIRDRHDMVTGATEQIRNLDGMVTGATEQIRNCRDIVTGLHKEVTYCSPSISSGKQKKIRSTSQPQFRSEGTPATIEANHILLALQHLANTSILPISITI